MLCGECYMVEKIDGEYISDCELPKGCDLTGKIVWDDRFVKENEDGTKVRRASDD